MTACPGCAQPTIVTVDGPTGLCLLCQAAPPAPKPPAAPDLRLTLFAEPDRLGTLDLFA